MIGTTLAHYRITGELGSGGMGEVWRAEDEKLGREVAVKVLAADVAQDPERLARFEREAKVLASLNHPNIAHLYGLETVASGSGTGPNSDADDNSKFKIQNSELTAPAVTFLVMELVEGEDLSDRSSWHDPHRRSDPDRAPDRRGARSGARGGDRPPRSQTGEHQDQGRRHGEGPRLRAREGVGG